MYCVQKYGIIIVVVCELEAAPLRVEATLQRRGWKVGRPAMPLPPLAASCVACHHAPQAAAIHSGISQAQHAAAANSAL